MALDWQVTLQDIEREAHRDFEMSTVEGIDPESDEAKVAEARRDVLSMMSALEPTMTSMIRAQTRKTADRAWHADQLLHRGFWGRLRWLLLGR